MEHGKDARELMTRPGSLRGSPWAFYSAASAWGIAIVLILIVRNDNSAFASIVVPPVIFATIPTLVPRRHKVVASLIATVLLALWGIFGIAMLGPYFLPSAILSGIDYAQRRRRGTAGGSGLAASAKVG